MSRESVYRAAIGLLLTACLVLVVIVAQGNQSCDIENAIRMGPGPVAGSTIQDVETEDYYLLVACP